VDSTVNSFFIAQASTPSITTTQLSTQQTGVTSTSLPTWLSSLDFISASTVLAAIITGIIALWINRSNQKTERKHNKDRRNEAIGVLYLKAELDQKYEELKEQRLERRELIRKLDEELQKGSLMSSRELVSLAQYFPENSKEQFSTYIIAIQSYEGAKRLAKPNRMAEAKNQANCEYLYSEMRAELEKLKRERFLI